MFPTSLLLLLLLLALLLMSWGKLSHKTHRGVSRAHPPTQHRASQASFDNVFLYGSFTSTEHTSIIFANFSSRDFHRKGRPTKRSNKEEVVVRWKQSLKSIEKLPSSAGKVFKLSHARITLYVHLTAPAAPPPRKRKDCGWLVGV